MSRRLTESSIKRTTPAAREIVLCDSLAPGLVLRISPRGVRSWAFSTRLNTNRKVKMKLGRWPALSLVDARTKARELANAVATEQDPRDTYRPPATVTVRELTTAFVRDWCMRRNRRWEEQQRILVRIVGQEWGWTERQVPEITRREISEQLRGMIGDDGQRAICANRVHAVLHKMLKWGASNGYLEASPMLGMGKPSPERIRDRVLTDDEVRAVWIACHKWRRGEHLHPMAGAVLMALLTGQRMGEVMGLRWDEVGADGVWRLPAARVKNKRAHSVPLPLLALKSLAAMPRIGEFPFGGKPFTSGSKRRLDALVRAELGDGFPDWRLHDLRRTVRSGLAAAGVSWEMQHRIQNHLSPLGAMDRIYQRYDHIEEIRSGLGLWEARLLTVVHSVERSV